MKITYFVNTMTALEGKNTKVLFDPWITFGNTADNNFYNFPETKITPAEVSALKPDYIYITHTHCDHFDPITLAQFNKSTPIIISWYEDNFTYRNVANLGFSDIRVSNPENGIELGDGDRCWLSPGTKYPEVDSVGVFEIDGLRVVNLNDNPFEETFIRRLHERFAPIDIALIPFAAHGPYPMFYENLKHSEKSAVAQQRCQKSYGDFVKFIDILKPRYVMPFAGGLVCGGPKALQYKYSGIGSRTDAVKFALEKTRFEPLFLSTKQTYDFETNCYTGNYVEHTHSSDWDYLEQLAQKHNRFEEGGTFYISPAEHIDLTKLLQNARMRQHKYQIKRQVVSDLAFFIDVGDSELYRMSLANTDITKIREEDIEDDYYEIFRLPYSLLIGLLTRHYIWSNIKTQHVTYYRKPDVFFQEIHTLMNYLQL